MNIFSIVMVVLKLLPTVMANLTQMQSMSSPEAKIEFIAQSLLNLLPDDLAPAIIPEIKLGVSAAMKIYDETKPLIDQLLHHGAAAAPAAAVAATGTVQVPAQTLSVVTGLPSGSVPMPQ